MWSIDVDEEADLSDSSPVYYGESDWMIARDCLASTPPHVNCISNEESGFRLITPDWPNAEGGILLLKHPLSLALTGKLAVKVLWGSVDVYGFIITPKHDSFFHLFSPISNCLLKLKTSCELKPTKDRERVCGALIQQHRWSKKEANEVAKYVQTHSVGLLFQDMPTQSTAHLERFYPSLFRSNCCVRGVPSSLLPTAYKCELFDPTTVPSIYCEDWYSIADNVRSQQGQSTPRIVICGGKNVGKSTMLRFLINCLLNDFQKVCCLDGDPGQSEFTPPGLLSLLTISEPCLGPGFTQQRKPTKSIFIGSCTPADHPSHYISSFKDLVKLYKKSYSKLPLVVNTMGWNRGIGLSLLSDMIYFIQPTHVIQIDSKAFPSRNFSDLSCGAIEKTPGWMIDVPNISQPYVHIIKQSPITFESDQIDSIKFRDIALLSYLCAFQHQLQPWQGISHFAFHRIPWSCIALHVYGGMKDYRDILYAFNGCLVALCHCDSSEIISTSNEHLPKLLGKMPVCHCYGYGIIRGIEMDEQCFYVSSSLDCEQLAKVNAFIKGSFDVPLKLVVEQETRANNEGDSKVRHLVPYTVVRKTSRTKSLIGQKCVPARSFKMKR